MQSETTSASLTNSVLAPVPTNQQAVLFKSQHNVLPHVDLPDRIDIICGTNGHASASRRFAAAHVLGQALSRREIERLYAFLSGGQQGQADMDPLDYLALKNDVLQALIAQASLPGDLLGKIVSMSEDQSGDPRWRDYCLQHLVMYYERRWPPDDARRLADPERLVLLGRYEKAIRSREPGLTGTALLGLQRISETYPEIDRIRVADDAVTLSTDAKTDPSTRVTALGLCSLMRRPEILPTARILAQTGESVPMRLAAIGCLGVMGTPEDEELLRSLALNQDEHIRKAADIALKRHKAREGR